jgi:hypothetical protein
MPPSFGLMITIRRYLLLFSSSLYFECSHLPRFEFLHAVIVTLLDFYFTSLIGVYTVCHVRFTVSFAGTKFGNLKMLKSNKLILFLVLCNVSFEINPNSFSTKKKPPSEIEAKLLFTTVTSVLTPVDIFLIDLKI